MNNEPAPKKEFLSIEDMTKRYGVCRTTFWKMRKAKKVPPPDIEGPDRWKRDKLDAYENGKNSDNAA